jgi:hypothetical protein
MNTKLDTVTEYTQMTTYWRNYYNQKWTKIEDDVDLEAFGLSMCNEEAGQDSDNGYAVWFEFYRNGERTYAYAEFDCWDDRFDMCGQLNLFVYGDIETINSRGEGWFKRKVEPGLNPERDWIRLGV